MMLWSEAHWVWSTLPFTLPTSLAFYWETMAERVRCHCFWFMTHPRSFFLLTWLIEAVVCDYKFWLGFLAMQEESNPLWFNNFLPHFGTTTDTCTEVSPSTDHRDVRWLSSCDEFLQIAAEFPLSPECMTVRTFSLTKEEGEWSFAKSLYWPVKLEIWDWKPLPPISHSLSWCICNH